MEKQDYIDRSIEIGNEIYDLQNEQRQIDEKYIAANAEFFPGEKVKVITKGHKTWELKSGEEGWNEPSERFAFVSKNIIYNNEVIPQLLKCKKDGTPSKQRDYVGMRSYVEKLTN